MNALPCGTSSEDLLDRVASRDPDAGPDTETDPDAVRHQAACPHCRATLDEYRRLWAPVHELAGEVVRAPRAVIDRALARVQAVAAHPTAGLLDADPAGAPGTTRITARVVVICAREAAGRVAGVRGALGHVEVGLAGTTADLELTLAASYGHDLQALGRAVRDRVAREVGAATGLAAVSVSVRVDDVFT